MSASVALSSTGFIENLMEELCEGIRSGDPRTFYSELIADSIEEAIHACFPLLRRTVGDAQIRSWATCFVRQHRCTEPQFFHVATEFVRFANELPALSEVHRSLMEYEWLMLATEIDNVSVPLPVAQISVCELWQGNAYIAINPTLSEVGLPFDMQDITAGKPISKRDETRNYAVYRSSEHRVYSQSLTGIDRQLLTSIRDKQTIKPELAEQLACHEAPGIFTERWLSHFCKTDAVIYISKKQGYSI